MSDFPRQGGKGPATPHPPIKSGVPTTGSPNGGKVDSGHNTGGTGSNDKRKAK